MLICWETSIELNGATPDENSSIPKASCSWASILQFSMSFCAWAFRSLIVWMVALTSCLDIFNSSFALCSSAGTAVSCFSNNRIWLVALGCPSVCCCGLFHIIMRKFSFMTSMGMINKLRSLFIRDSFIKVIIFPIFVTWGETWLLITNSSQVF